jgi:hypothetical protein
MEQAAAASGDTPTGTPAQTRTQMEMIEAGAAVVMAPVAPTNPANVPAPGSSPTHNGTCPVIPLDGAAMAALTDSSPDTQAPVGNQVRTTDAASFSAPLAFAARLEELPSPETEPSKTPAEPAAKPQAAAAAKPEATSEPEAGPRIAVPAAAAKELESSTRRAPFALAPEKAEEPKATARAASGPSNAPTLPIHRVQPATDAPVRATPSHGPAETVAARATEIDEMPVPRSAASSGLSLSLGQPGGEQVEIRIQERQGGVQVAVRSPDPALNSSLRGELSALVSRLESRGYTAETWAPAETVNAPARTSSGGFSEPQQQSGEGHPSGGGGGQSNDSSPGREGRGNQGQHPRWLEEWAFSTTPRKSTNI